MFENLQLPGEGRDKAFTHCCWCFPIECGLHFTGIVWCLAFVGSVINLLTDGLEFIVGVLVYAICVATYINFAKNGRAQGMRIVFIINMYFMFILAILGIILVIMGELKYLYVPILCLYCYLSCY